jgi:Flp pilus assembly protein TadG
MRGLLQPTVRTASRRTRRGSALIELTLSLSFLTALFLGTWQYGYGFYVYAQLEQAVRDGARYAAGLTYDSATSTPSDTYLAAVQNVVVYGDPAPSNTATPVAPGLTKGNVTLTVTFTSGVPTSIAVGISGYQMPTYFGNVTLSGKPTTSFPFVGIFGPP